jgi:hypothetical protein
MKKAKAEDFIKLREEFKLSNSINDNYFNELSTLKFYKTTLLKDFYDLSLSKTDLEDNPLAISYRSKRILTENEHGKFIESKLNSKQPTEDENEAYEYSLALADTLNSIKPTRNDDFNAIPILNNSDKQVVKIINDILDDSDGFKDFISKFNLAFSEKNHLTDFSYTIQNLPIVKLCHTFNCFKDVMNSNDVSAQSVSFYVKNIIDLLDKEIPLDANLRPHKFEHKFNITVIDADQTYIELMDDYYKEFDDYFYLFQAKESVVLGVMANAKSEEDMLNTPVLNDFISFIENNRPEWFKSVSDSMMEIVIDDNTIRASGIPLSETTADFDLIDPKISILSAEPSLTYGYHSLSKRYLESDYNYIHISGDNSFFKMYYHNLCIEQRDNLKVCFVIDSALSYTATAEEKLAYIAPVLDYLQEHKIVLHLDHTANSSLLTYIKPDELANLIKNNYPNLLSLYQNGDFLKAIAITEAKSYDEAFELYKSTDDGKTIKNKIKNKI